jgi:hypothetical protein
MWWGSTVSGGVESEGRRLPKHLAGVGAKERKSERKQKKKKKDVDVR